MQFIFQHNLLLVRYIFSNNILTPLTLLKGAICKTLDKIGLCCNDNFLVRCKSFSSRASSSSLRKERSRRRSNLRNRMNKGTVRSAIRSIWPLHLRTSELARQGNKFICFRTLSKIYYLIDLFRTFYACKDWKIFEKLSNLQFEYYLLSKSWNYWSTLVRYT